MKKILCVLLAALLLAGCSAGTAEPETTAGGNNMLPKDKTYNILFIGNSYTFFNDMPTAYFEPIVKSLGYQVTVTAITKGAYTLEKFADPHDTYGILINNTLSSETKYDYVIIQEQSARPAVNPGAFYDGVRLMAEKIRNAGAQPILYATWGRKDGSDTLTKYDMTSEEMTWRLAAAYDAIGKELDIPVVHVGCAFREIYTTCQSIELYNPDKSHPSPAGSYMAAMALACGIFGFTPDDITIAGPLSAEEEAAVRNAVAQPPAIPQEYLTNSTGVTAPTDTTEATDPTQ